VKHTHHAEHKYVNPPPLDHDASVLTDAVRAIEARLGRNDISGFDLGLRHAIGILHRQIQARRDYVTREHLAGSSPS
jgi:hypothetical protein